MNPDRVPALELKAVAKSFGSFQAVKPLDMIVPRGATYGLLGPNGAGKTTTIRMIMRILQPDSGEIRLLGQPLSQEGLDRIGYLPEERGVYKRMKVRSLLAFFAELKGIPRRESRSRIEHWLDRLELGDRADARVQELSKGMQQKVQFIAAILHDPEVLILDEPFSGLDPINQRVLREIVSDLQRAGQTIVFSTHIIEHAERLCDHVCILARGSAVAEGPLSEVKQKHGTNYVRIRAEGQAHAITERLERSSLVGDVREHGNEVEALLRPDADAQAILIDLVRADVRLRSFEVAEPSLEQIFVERVHGERTEAEAPAHV